MIGITDGSSTIYPIVVGWRSSRSARSIVHEILGNENSDTTLRPAKLRAGTLRLVFQTPEAAAVAEELHAQAAVFTLTSEEITSLDMSYVVADGDIALSKDPSHWVLEVPFKEIAT